MTKTSRNAFALAVFLTAAAQAQVWIEPRDSDAGRTVPTAQVPIGIGDLVGIQGVLDGGADSGVLDYEDLFAIQVTDPLSFSATTITLGGGADVDTNLWLFAPSGNGLLGNLDFPGGGPFSRLLPIADDGSFALTAPGLYYIGVSGGSANRPTSGANQIFHFLTPLELSGPDGPGGAGVLSNWTGGGEIGAYFIQLTGVSYVPSPGIAPIFGFALISAQRRRRSTRA